MNLTLKGVVADLGRPYSDGAKCLEIRIPQRDVKQLKLKTGQLNAAAIVVGGREFQGGLRTTQANPNATISPRLQSTSGARTTLGHQLVASGFAPNEVVVLQIIFVPSAHRAGGRKSLKLVVTKESQPTSAKSEGEAAAAPRSASRNGSARDGEGSGSAHHEALSYLRRLWPDEDVLHLVVKAYGDAIVFASELNASRWGLTGHPHVLRLNVGKLEAVLANSARLSLMVNEPALQHENDRLTVRSIHSGEFGRYRSVPTAGFLQFKLTDAAMAQRQIDAIGESHKAHLRLAVKTALNPAAKGSHSAQLVAAMSVLLSVELPQPSYVSLEWSRSATTGVPASSETSGNIFDDGNKRDVVQTVYERSAAARVACLRHYGYTCTVCEVKLEDVYGPIAKDLIHVHHLNSFRDAPGPRRTDAVKDLRPLCPNCHAVAHLAEPDLSLDQLRTFVKSKRKR